MLASLITRPLRIATRSAQITLHGAHEAVELAEGLLGLVASRLIGHNGHSDAGHEAAEGARRSPEPEAWRGPAASSTSAPADRAAPAARRAATETTGTTTSPANGKAPTAPTPPAAATPSPGETRSPAPTVETPGTAEAAEAEPPAPEPVHVDEGIELVEEVAEPGAEEGAGAQLRIVEPWDGYGSMKAADVVDRLATATPEELAAVELYELSGRNRKSVVAAAQRALKRASPPR